MRTSYIYFTIAFLLIPYAIGQIPKCPSCNKECTPIFEIKDDVTKPSKNLSVWNRSMCASLIFYTHVCKEHFYAYCLTFKKWELSLEGKNAFPIKLHKSIHQMPISKKPRYRVVYSQEIYEKRREDSVAFWFIHDEKYIHYVKDYVKANNLEMRLEEKKDKDESYVVITKSIKLK